MAECSEELREWAAAAGLQDVVPTLAALGVEMPGDILLLEECHTAPMIAEMRPVQQAKFARALGALRNGAVAVAVSAPSEDALAVPEYKPQPLDSASEFTALEGDRGQHVTLLGHSMPARTAAGGVGAFLLLVIVVLVLLGVNSANDSCVNVQCGAFGTCADGSCACQPGYTGALLRAASSPPRFVRSPPELVWRVPPVSRAVI